MDLILHIGLPKTGSTSIQFWLAETYTPKRENVYVPDESVLPGTVAGNHTGLALFTGAASVWCSKLGNNIRRELSPELQRLSPDAFRNVFRKHLETCATMAEECECRAVLLSNENLSERLDKATLNAFSKCVRTVFAQTTAVVYLREQSHACVSLYGDSLRHGNRTDFRDFIASDPIRRLIDYRSLLDNWEECGWDVRPLIYYERGSRPPEWQLITNFAAAIRNDSTSRISRNIEPNYNRNTSIPPDSFFIKLAMNRLNLSDHIQPIIQYKLLRIAAKAPFLKGRFSRRNASQLDYLRDLCIDGNRAVAEKYFNRFDLFGSAGS